MASSTKSSDINISPEPKSTDSISMGSPLQKSSDKNHSVNSTEATTEGSANLNKADPKNLAEHPKIQTQQVNSEDSEKENPQCKNNTGTMNPPVSQPSGDPKNSTDPISTAVEGSFVLNHEVNAEFAVPNEGSIPDLVNEIMKKTKISDKSFPSGLDPEKIMEIASQITEKILKYSSAAVSKGKSVENVCSGVPTSGVRGFSNPALEEGEIVGVEASQGGALSNPLVGGSSAIPVSAAANSMGFSADKSAGLASEGANVPPPVVQPIVVGGSSGDPSPATGLSKSFLEATSASQSDAVLGSVDFSAAYPTVIFTADECEQVSSFYRFAIIGKFSYGKPSNQMISQQLKTEGFGTCKVHFLNGKHVLINLSKEPVVVPLWVKIHALPPQWFDLRSLKTIASSVGEFLKADEPTHNRSRLSFARVCVEVNLKNHLPKKINLQVGEDSVPLDIEFEKVPQYCNYCKHIGHDIHKCYMKNPALKPAVFTNKNFNAQQVPTAATTGNLNITLSHQATASGEVSANHDDAFQTVGKGFKLNRSFPPPKITLVSNVVSNPFDILSQDEELCDGLNLEASTREPCPLDKNPVASLHNLGHTNPSPVLPASHGPLNNFDQEELIDVVILEGSTDNTNSFFTQDPVTFQNLGSDQVGTSKTKVMDNQAYYSADELEGLDNYNSDGSVHSGKSLPDQPFPDHVPVSKVVGTEMILFKNKHKNPAPFNILALIEPKVDLNTNFFLKRFGFHSVCANVSNHIWLFTETDTKIQILKNTEQMLHVEVNCSSIPTVFFLTVVYGRHTKIQRRDLWDDLLSVSQNQVPWMVGGDFNIILQPEEKKGGAGPIQSDMEEFSDCLLNCNLSDVGFAGTPFTWYRDGVAKTRSDFGFPRVVFQFPFSVHSFQNMWVKHHLFLPTVQESWGIHSFSRGMLKLSEKLVRLKYTLKEWNTHHFGNIFNKIDQAQYAVEVAEKDFDLDPSTSNRSYLNKMNANLTLTLSMEEDFWKQKANMKWMLEGERNSKFFHNLVKKKRQKNFLHCIRDNGCLIPNPEDIHVSAVNYFSKCFGEQMPILDEIDPNLVPKIITHEQNNMLCVTPTIDEIRSCVFDMEGDSVAGPDGFGIRFFQICWDIISSDVFDAVVDFFSGSPMPRAFTTTTISLIPKNNNLQSWKDFRPISLCNSTYKIISKILSKRLGTILPSFINLAQSGFIKGKNITDNILTAHEVTHDISQSMTNTIIKLDMEKAYDRINWNFIFQVMTRFGFSAAWVNFIKSCVSNCWFSILVNGQSAGFFKSDRGIRQGDPLSPLIFAIAADYFSRSIDKMFDRNPTMFYKIKKKVKITHLAYADDILIFLNATKKNLHLLNNCLTHYENVSGQKVNNFKSNFIMYKPTPQVANWVQRISGFKNATLPVMYLGVPLWKGFQSFEMCSPLISKIKIKLLNWNHHLLSTGGRLGLIKSVLNSIAFFSLQVLKPPENVIIALERIFNKFLWGTSDNRRRLHWAAWSRLCYPTDEGGLGCRDLHDIIRAGICKIWWRFRTSNNIWSNFLMNKYCPRLHPMTIKLSLKSSHVWKNLCDVRSIANTKIFWHSGNGNVSFWHDSWCDMSPLNDFSNNKSKDTIQNYWINGKWDRRKISGKLSIGLCDHICSFPTSPSGILPSWTLSPAGDFDFKSTWHFVRKKKPLNNILRFRWNPIITPTISVFMVRLVNKWFPTPDGLLRRGIYATNFCYCCNDDENIPRLFIHGPVANKWWNDRRVDNVPFTANRVCERIWNYINTFNHKVNFKNKKFWIGAALIADRVGVTAAPKTFFKCCSVRWSKPQPGWWNLNTDGAARGNPGDAAAGVSLGTTWVNLWLCFRGLEFCIDNRFNKVWVEVDSKIALSLIEHSTTSHWQLQSIISKIRDFRGSIEIRFSHIFREGNAVADWLANHGCDRKDFFLHYVFSISGKLLGIIKLDKMSYPYIRSKKTFIS
ncbi:hypothetical protein OROMI_014672 [Orobanche minor]